MAGQHFAVGIDVDAFAFGLLQDGVQILQVVAGNENGLALLGAQGHGGGHGVAVGAGVAGIQQFHGPQVDFAALERQADIVVDAQAVVQGGRQAFVDIGVDLFVFLPQDAGMVGIGGQRP